MTGWRRPPRGRGSRFLASLARLDPSPNLLDQLSRLGEPVRLLERKHDRLVDRDIVDAVVAGDESEGGQRLAEFLQNRVRVLDRLGQISTRSAVANRDFRHPTGRRNRAIKR